MSEYTVLWNGAMHRKNETKYSLLGDGYSYRRNALQEGAPERGAYPSGAEIKRAILIPADVGWRSPVIDPASRKVA